MVQWIDEPEAFHNGMRGARVLSRAKDKMPAIFNAWADQGRDLMLLALEREGDPEVKLVVGGPNAIIRIVDARGADMPEGWRASIRAALFDVWDRTDAERSALPALVVWEKAGRLEMVAMTLDEDFAKRWTS